MGQISLEKNVGGIEGLCVITPAVHGDERGYFMETYNVREMQEAGFDIKFVQDNQSMSVKRSIARTAFSDSLPTVQAGACRSRKRIRRSGRFKRGLCDIW